MITSSMLHIYNGDVPNARPLYREERRPTIATLNIGSEATLFFPLVREDGKALTDEELTSWVTALSDLAAMLMAEQAHRLIEAGAPDREDIEVEGVAI